MGKRREPADKADWLGSEQLRGAGEQPGQVQLVSWPGLPQCGRVPTEQWHQRQFPGARE